MREVRPSGQVDKIKFCQPAPSENTLPSCLFLIIYSDRGYRLGDTRSHATKARSGSKARNQIESHHLGSAPVSASVRKLLRLGSELSE